MIETTGYLGQGQSAGFECADGPGGQGHREDHADGTEVGALRVHRVGSEPVGRTLGRRISDGNRRRALFEYACHEGNYGLPNTLRGVREEEKARSSASHHDRPHPYPPSDALARSAAGGVPVLGQPHASAHHSFAAEFDIDKPVEFHGKVLKVELINPHSWIHLEVTDRNGATETWMIEGRQPQPALPQGIHEEQPAGRHGAGGGGLPGSGWRQDAPWAGR